MDKIRIVNRELTAAELKRMNTGFDELAIEEGFELESSDRISFVALEGNSFIGCASGLAYKNGSNYSGWFYLTDLFVEKAYRSKGLGAQLLKSMEAELHSAGLKRIWLWTSGDKAIKFYYRHEYAEFAEMENWYSDGSSRIGLRKDL